MAFDFDRLKRTEDKAKELEGNEYDVMKPGERESYRKIWRSCWAVSSGDSLFINCKKLGISPGFNLVLESGALLAFKGSMITTHDQEHGMGA